MGKATPHTTDKLTFDQLESGKWYKCHRYIGCRTEANGYERPYRFRIYAKQTSNGFFHYANRKLMSESWHEKGFTPAPDYKPPYDSYTSQWHDELTFDQLKSGHNYETITGGYLGCLNDSGEFLVYARRGTVPDKPHHYNASWVLEIEEPDKAIFIEVDDTYKRYKKGETIMRAKDVEIGNVYNIRGGWCGKVLKAVPGKPKVFDIENLETGKVRPVHVARIEGRTFIDRPMTTETTPPKLTDFQEMLLIAAAHQADHNHEVPSLDLADKLRTTPNRISQAANQLPEFLSQAMYGKYFVEMPARRLYGHVRNHLDCEELLGKFRMRSNKPIGHKEWLTIKKKWAPYRAHTFLAQDTPSQKGETMNTEIEKTKKEMIQEAWDAGWRTGPEVAKYVKQTYGVDVPKGTLDPYLSKMRNAPKDNGDGKPKRKKKTARPAPAAVRNGKPKQSPNRKSRKEHMAERVADIKGKIAQIPVVAFDEITMDDALKFKEIAEADCVCSVDDLVVNVLMVNEAAHKLGGFDRLHSIASFYHEVLSD